MKTLEESVVIAMDGSDKELFPFLSYILQDLWEIGADPDAIIKLIRKYYNCCSQKHLKQWFRTRIGGIQIFAPVTAYPFNSTHLYSFSRCSK